MKNYQKNNTIKRHNFTPDYGDISSSEIKTIESLKEHLQFALMIEHATIPPYLFALYSIKEGTNPIASAVIRSVVMEEMLHMILVANILNSIGGCPLINSREFLISYPGPLPHSDAAFNVSLRKFSPDAIRDFLKIEMPAKNDSLPQAHKFDTIGQFYKSISIGIQYVEKATSGGIFKGEPGRQIGSEHYYGSGGKLYPVCNLADALSAIQEIVGQGEGVDGTIFDTDDHLFGDDIEYAHYFRFNEILQEQFYDKNDKPKDKPSGQKLAVDWDGVYDVTLNPKTTNYVEGSPVWEKSNEFNKTYTELLNNIHVACNGKPEALMQGISLMYDLKYKAVELMKTPTGVNNTMAGPSFEYAI